MLLKKVYSKCLIIIFIICVSDLVMLGIAQEKRQTLKEVEKDEIAQQLQLLIDYGNAGDWKSYTQFLLLYFSSYKSQFIEQRQKHYPFGFRHKIVGFKLVKIIKDETGTWPADWIISFTLNVYHSDGEKIYSAYMYASQRNEKWYFIEPSIDGCIKGCNEWPFEFVQL